MVCLGLTRLLVFNGLKEEKKKSLKCRARLEQTRASAKELE